MADNQNQPPPPKPPKKRKKPKRTKPSWKPSEQQKGEIRAMLTLGLSHAEVAHQLAVDPKTLRKHCRDLIDNAKISFGCAVVTSLGRQAIGAPAVYDAEGRVLREEMKPSVSACDLILRTQFKEFGWVKETRLTGKGGESLLPQPDLTKATDDDLQAIEKARSVLSRLAGDSGGLDATRASAPKR